jgi:hypothetical protein
MSTPRLKSELWVLAQIRTCDRHSIQAVVAHKGDPDSGAILVDVEDAEGRHVVWTQILTVEGERGWMRGTGPEPVDGAAAAAYVQRARERDYDIWVLDIYDRKGTFKLDGPIL